METKQKQRTMKTYNELARMTKEERFNEVFVFVTTGIKNNTVLEVVKDSLLGIKSKGVMSLHETRIISELCAKAFINAKQSNCLIEMAKVNVDNDGYEIK